MRRIIIFSLLMLLLSAMSMHATDDRAKWFKELRQYKHEFLAKELGLTKDQQSKFFPIYSEMTKKIMRLNDDTRTMEGRIDRSKTEVSDLEYEKGAEALFELKAKRRKSKTNIIRNSNRFSHLNSYIFCLKQRKNSLAS